MTRTTLVSVVSLVSLSLSFLEVHGSLELQQFWPEPGFRPPAQPLRDVLHCAARCCHDTLCPGFDVTIHGPDASCTLLRLPNIAASGANANVTLYWKSAFVAPVLGTRPQVDAGSGFHILISFTPGGELM